MARSRLLHKNALVILTAHPVGDAQLGNVLFDDPRRRHMSLDERRAGGPAAQGLEAQGPGAGEQVDRMVAGRLGADQIEDRLADAVLHRPHDRVAVIAEPPAAKMSADDPQLGVAAGVGRAKILRSGLAGRRCWAMLSVFRVFHCQNRAVCRMLFWMGIDR